MTPLPNDLTPRLALKEQILDCRGCDLCEVGTGPVPFSGPTPSYVAVVGEAPGQMEDKGGKPFIGPSGKLLREALAEAGFNVDELFIANSVSCLRGDTRVRLRGGEWEQIGMLVKKRYADAVWSVDVNGRLVTRRVTGWHRNDLGGRRLLHVSYVGARQSRDGGAGAVVTADHLLLSGRGWVEAGDLKPDDEIATGVRGFSPHQHQTLLAGRLGDGRPTSEVRVAFSFHADERAYAEEKARLFGASAEPRGRGWQVVIERERALTGLPSDPVELVRNLDDIGLAVWFMDDGHLRVQDGRQSDAQLSVARFPLEVVEQMALALNKKGFIAWARSSSMGPRIFFGTEGTPILSRRIAPFVVPSMARKVLPDDRAMVQSWSPQERQVYYAPVVTREVTPRPHERTVYCLSVEETENFITPGGVVHNCYPGAGQTPTARQVNACSGNLRSQLELANATWALLLGGVALSTLRTDCKINRARGHVFLSDDRLWFATFHPSHALRSAKAQARMKADLVTFHQMVLAEDWLPLTTDDCLGCGVDTDEVGEHDEAMRFDDMGGPWCEPCWRKHTSEGKALMKNERFQARTGELFP